MRRRGHARLRLALRPLLDDDVVYLSDIDPVSASVHGGLHRDRGYSVDRITLAGLDYPKGLTTHPLAKTGSAEVVYDLRPYHGNRHRFRALVGIPRDVSGSVEFLVHTRTAGGPWVEAARTEVLTAASDPVDIEVQLDDADELRLYVTDGGDGINSDHAAWALARLE
jgi:hypothetical protein